jgi:hypothetical protein
MDIIPPAIEYVRSLGIPAEMSFSLGDVTMVGDEAVDIVTCLDCNCYWPDQRSELQYAFGKLKPGGYLAMRVVDKSWMCSLGLAIGRAIPYLSRKILMTSVNDHRFSMPIRSLLKVLESCDFEVMYASPRGAIPSYESRGVVKFSFALGSLMWAVTGIFLAPGALVLARKSRH